MRVQFARLIQNHEITTSANKIDFVIDSSTPDVTYGNDFTTMFKLSIEQQQVKSDSQDNSNSDKTKLVVIMIAGVNYKKNLFVSNQINNNV